VRVAALAVGAAVLASAAASAAARLVPESIAWGHGASIAVSSSRGVSVVDAQTGAARLLTPLGRGGASLDWSPDGRTLLFDDRFKLYTVRSDGTGTRSLGRGYFGRWSPDGRRIAFFRRDGLFVMRADGSRAHEVIRDRYNDLTGPPSWSPDGRRIAFVSCSAAFLSRPCEHQFGFDVYTISAAGGTKRRVTRRSGFPQCVTWSSAGNLAFTNADLQLTIVRRDGSLHTYRISGCPTWAPGGRRLAASGRFGPTLVNADGSGRFPLRVLPKRTEGLMAVAWSPDGRQIAFATNVGGKAARLYVVGADGRGRRLLS
jgi:Tol biopolymer transport system component